MCFSFYHLSLDNKKKTKTITRPQLLSGLSEKLTVKPYQMNAFLNSAHSVLQEYMFNYSIR